MNGYCSQCDRTVYVIKGEVPACPVCSMPLTQPRAEGAPPTGNP